MLLLLGVCFLIMAASLVSVIAVWNRAGTVIEKNLDYLVSFSAGVFIVFLYGLGVEAIEHAQSPTWGVTWILMGAIGIWVLFKLLPTAHVHGREHRSAHAPLDPRRLIFTDGIHNIADGIFLAASYAVSPTLALIAGISIFIHETLQEISEFFVLRDAGMSVKKALEVNFLVSSTILVGALGGYFLLESIEILEAPLLGIAAGGLLIVVLHDLIPHSVRESITHAHYGRHILSFLLGCALMLGVSMALPHVEVEHEEGVVAHEEESR